MSLKVLIACEESQEVCKAFRALEHEAFSCDILPCSGGRPEWHIQEDVLLHVDTGEWDLMIAFPPCTYLCSSGLHWNKRIPGRDELTHEAMLFVFSLLDAPIEHIALENPIGCISSNYRKPDQIIQPWQFGHPESKSTCLWLKNLPLLEPTEIADFKRYGCKVCGNTFSPEMGKYGCCPEKAARPIWDNMTPSGQNKLGPSDTRAMERSKTYPGIAAAMAKQWSDYIILGI